MNSVFTLKVAVSVFAFDKKSRALYSAFGVVLIVEDLNAEASVLRPAGVHAKKHFGPVLSVQTARAGVTREQSVSFVVFLGEEGAGHKGVALFAKGGVTVVKLLFKLRIAVLAAKLPEARLLLVGDGELRADAERRCAELGIAERVIFTGTVSNTCDYYQAMDLFCLPSLFEGLPVVAVEAQVAELPVLVSEEVTREVNISGQVGFLSLKSPEDWAKAMEARASQGRVPLPDGPEKDAFNIKVQAGKLEAYYEERLARLKK